jgi:hypothetical protein
VEDAGSGAERALLANLMWTAKEAAAKVRREGLRLDVRDAATRLGDGGEGPGGWIPLAVSWRGEDLRVEGWWRRDRNWVMAVAGEPAVSAPTSLD